MHFHNTTLPNGLEIIAECNDNAHTSAMGFFVKTGARDEHDEVSGVSHFLEHMVFKGTARRSADEVNLEFDRMGADYNAYTSEESTVYHANILPEFQDRTVELLGEPSGEPVTTWRFVGCRPVALDYSPLNALESAIMIETISLTFDDVVID